MVVPVAVAVGWELAPADRVVVVHEVRPTTLVVIDSTTGKTEEVAIVREDDGTNSKDEPGSELSATDTSTPARELDEEVEVTE
jgi:hypothetical protein